MNVNMDGRAIRRFATSEGCWTTPSPTRRYHLSASYHGDRDEFWVVCCDAESGVELSRFNANTLHAIEWSTP